MLHGSSSTTSPMSRVRVPRHVARLVVDFFTHDARPGASSRRVACRTARHRLLRLRRTSECLGTSHGSSSTISPTPRVRVTWHVVRLVIGYFSHAVRPGASAHRTARRKARRRLLRLRHVSECLGTSRGSSSTTSPTPRVRVTRHVTRLVVDYFSHVVRPGASARHAAHRRLLRLARLIVDYFTYAAHMGASACRAARRRLLRPRCASGCLGTSHGTSCGSSSTTSTTPRVRVPRHVAGTSCGSSSTTSPMTRVRVPWHVARLVVDFFAYAARPGASTCRAARHRLLRLAQAHRRLFRLHRTSGCLGTSRGSSRRSSRLLHLRRASGCLGTSRGSSRGSSSTTPCVATSSCGHTGFTSATLCVATTCLVAHWLYFEYVAHRRDIVFRSHRVHHSSRLVFQTSRERQSRPQQLVGINSD
jgi:hypothetical protein